MESVLKIRNPFQKFLTIFSIERPTFWMLVSCGVWLWLFRDYLTGRIGLFSDAISYFDHSRFFVDSLKHGVFPLWDHFWNSGSPNDFFLRRIGAYTPVYLWMLVLKLLGLSWTTAYILGQSLYFFWGTWGFFLLVKTVYKDERVAFTAFLLLLFSAVGTRIFDSYMCLVIVPTIWFFYFSHAFMTAPNRRAWAGLVLSFMIAMNTYIPLFFLTIILVAAIFWVLFFPRETWGTFKRISGFVHEHPLFFWSIFGVGVLALVPPVAFFVNSASGGLSMPDRHGAPGASLVNHVLGVDPKLLSWGVMEDLFFTTFFMDFRRFILALVYVPFLWIPLWILGGVCRINRRVCFFFALGVFFLFLGTPLAVPLHAFLYKHVFYFKYIRNLHFFLWFILLPLFVFITAEFLSQLLTFQLVNPRRKAIAVSLIVVVHVALCLWVIHQDNGILSTYFALGASFCVCLWFALACEHARGWALWLALLIVIIPQSFQVFTYAVHNMPNQRGYAYDMANQDFAYQRPAGSIDLYYSTAGFSNLCLGISEKALIDVLGYKLVAYDEIEPFQGYDKLEGDILAHKDVAYVEGIPAPVRFSSGTVLTRFEKDSMSLRVTGFNSNRLFVDTDMPVTRLLSYQDCFSKGWHVFIDGHQEKLLEVARAFKGVIVPAGKHTVEFRYGSLGWYGLQWVLLTLFNVLFYGLVWAWWKNGREALK